MELLLPVERRLKAAPLLRKHVQQHRVLEGLEELEGLDEQRSIVAVYRAEVVETELLKKNGGPQHAFGGLFGAAHHFHGGFAAESLDEMRGLVVQVLVTLVGDNAMEVTRHRAHVAVDGPLVVVEDDDHAFGLRSDVVHGLEGDAVGESGVARDGDDVFMSSGQVARYGHTQRRGERRARVAGSVAVVLALSAQHEAVQAARLADGLKTFAAAGENFVDIGLVAHIEEDLILGRREDRVQGQGELDHAQIGAQMAACLRESLDEKFANLPGKLGELEKTEALHVGGRVDGLQQCSHLVPFPGEWPGVQGKIPYGKKPPARGSLSEASPPLIIPAGRFGPLLS